MTFELRAAISGVYKKLMNSCASATLRASRGIASLPHG
jgi:hypothetical protein